MLLCGDTTADINSFPFSRTMDFGVVSHKKHTSPTADCHLGSTTDPGDETRHGSVNLKHQRSGFSEESWRLPKMPRPGEVDFSLKKVNERFDGFGRSNLWPPSPVDDGQKMLSFSSSGGGGGSGRSIAFNVCQDEHQSRIGGIIGISGGIRGPFTRLKGPFTPSQWMELEHQALIYKHIVANVPIPSNLLLPLKRSLYPYGSHGSYASNFFGWGPFHLGFSGSNDPEPGRCRRTDGKKWRCSRDAVPDQKYCERHINRGRHRSRKPVEGQSGHAISANSKVAPINASSNSSQASMMMSSANSSNGLATHQRQLNSSQPDHLGGRSQGFQGLSLIPPTTVPKPKDAPPFSNNNQNQHVPFDESSQSQQFGFVSSDSLINPSGRIPESFLPPFAKGANNDQHPFRHFIDDWPKDQSSRAGPDSWPEELKSDWTQLSMSIPTMAQQDFSSSSTSPSQEKSSTTLRRLSSSHELDPIHMGLGMAQDLGGPIWPNSMGGPLGEVLTNRSPQVGSSPTGVLQRATTFVSLSNSSSASSGDNKKALDDASLCNDLLLRGGGGSAIVSSGAIHLSR